MRLGFTGTQRGMTRAQRVTLHKLLGLHDFAEAHHGDCIGADAEFDELLELHCVHTVIHPPLNNSKRAFCQKRWIDGETRRRSVISHGPRMYLERNHDIVRATSTLWAAPGEFSEQLRSGTWATVRYARKLNKLIRYFWPDGTTTTWAREASP